MKFLAEYIFPAACRAIRAEGYQSAIQDILVFKDKIYTGNVTLPGDQKMVSNCTFLGNEFGLKLVGGRNDTD